MKDESGNDRRYVGEQNLQGPQEKGWGYTQPELFDWDADGTLDLIGNDNTATFRLLKRTDRGGSRRHLRRRSSPAPARTRSCRSRGVTGPLESPGPLALPATTARRRCT